MLHGQRVWDAAQQVLATQGAVYIQGHCLQEQRIVYTVALLATEFVHTICAGMCRVYKFPKGTRTLEQSLVGYTSPGVVYHKGLRVPPPQLLPVHLLPAQITIRWKMTMIFDRRKQK